MSGPLIRGSGHRLRHPARRSPTPRTRTSTSRCRSRRRATATRATACGCEEFRESIRIVRQALDGLPEGPISSRPGVKSVGQVRVPKGEGYARVEGARGEIGFYIVADGGAEAVPDEVAGRVVLEPRGAAAHHPRPQDRRRRRDHGLGRPRLRRGRPLARCRRSPGTRSPPFILLNAVIGMVTYLTLLERKFAARMQSRIGPYYVGRPHGWLQPIADALKLMMKEDIVPTAADRWVYNLAPIVFLVPVLADLRDDAVRARTSGVADLNIGVLFFLAVSSLEIVGPRSWAAGGRTTSTRCSRAMRAVNQIISYDLPFIFAALVPVVLAGSLQLSAIVAAQQGSAGSSFYPVDRPARASSRSSWRRSPPRTACRSTSSRRSRSWWRASASSTAG